MKKNRQYFFRLAILKTLITATIYLIVPFFANWYIPKVGEYYGYAIFSSSIIILINFILIVQSWVLYFDAKERAKYLNEE